jgi:hypothetical protein
MFIPYKPRKSSIFVFNFYIYLGLTCGYKPGALLAQEFFPQQIIFYRNVGLFLVSKDASPFL